MPDRSLSMIVADPPRGAQFAIGRQDNESAAFGVPAQIAGWSVTPISAGLWLSEVGGPVPPEVLELRAERDRPSLVVDAAGPDAHTDELFRALFPWLASRTSEARLVLSGAADRYVAAARDCGLTLVAADDTVVITPHGYAIVWAAGQRDPVRPARGLLPQWQSYRPDGECEVAGVMSPSPQWERDLPGTDVILSGATVRRVPAGLAIMADLDAGAVRSAALTAEAVWPDPDRLTIVVGTGPLALLRDALAELLARLPLWATDGVRLYWPRAGVGACQQEMQELARQYATDLIAPAADVRASGFGAVCRGSAGAAPWVRLSSTGEVELEGSLYPAPAWEAELAEADLDGLGDSACVEHVAAGLCVYRPGQVERGFLATARSLLPDPDRLTVVVSGAASDHHVRQDVERLLDRLPTTADRRVLLLITEANAGGRVPFGQRLADALDGEVVVPVTGWTATPDGRPMALPAAGNGPREAPSSRWQVFMPRPAGPTATLADLTGLAAGPPPQALERSPRALERSPRALEPPPQALEMPPQAPQMPPDAPPVEDERPVSVAVLPRDQGSSVQDRHLYRQSAINYQSHAVAVRRVLTQRPGLRAAAAGDTEDAVVTDFAAVLDLISDDRNAVTAALRAGSAERDPRVACVISGFRRLPSFTGAVFTSAFLGAASPSIYVPGALLVEPAFVLATSSHVVALEGDIDYVIWSQTGKRLAALAVDAARDEILFPAGTMFRVLAIYNPPERDERAVAFLRESVRPPGGRSPAAGPSGEHFDEMDRRVLERLGTAASMRNGVRPDDRTFPRPAASGPLLIGFDARGVPFRGPIDG